MSVSKIIIENQDKSAMLNRLQDKFSKLYAEKTHFIYELLQNAEDAGATKVFFFQFADYLEMRHDGKPFTLSNLQSLCDAANSDKKQENDKIGKFGVGFMSVYRICDMVALYSEPENWPIKDADALPKFAVKIHYADPSDIEEEWKMAPPYTTRFIFPYDCGENYKTFDELRKDVADKLRSLGNSVLLFLRHIKEINYVIKGVDTDLEGKGTYSLIREPLAQNICRVVASGETDSKEDDSSYLVFSKKIEGTERTVDIAFSIVENSDAIEFTRASSRYVSVYFPTETESKLNFIVQAPFDLTPNRSSMERNSERNIKLVELLTSLFRDVIIEIRERKWLTLDFINLLPFDSGNPDYDTNWYFYPFHELVCQMLETESIIPTIDGDYVNIEDAKIQRSTPLLELFKKERLGELLNNPKAKWLPKEFTENSPSLKGLHRFLKEMGAEEIGSDNLAKHLRANPTFMERVDDEWLVRFYDYLAEIKNILGRNGNLAMVPFIKTADGKINAPFIYRTRGAKLEIEQNIFSRPQNAKVMVEDFLFVDKNIEEKCKNFVELLDLNEPDGFDYFVRELEIMQDCELIEDETNVAQVKQAVRYLSEGRDRADKIFSDWLWVRVVDTDGESKKTKAIKHIIYREKDFNGVSLKDYFMGVKNTYIYILDEFFYTDAGLKKEELEILEKIGIRDSVYENIIPYIWKDGRADCRNRGDFRKGLFFTRIKEIIWRINNPSNETVSGRQSAAVFKLLQNVSKHLKGKWEYGSTRPEIRDGVAEIITYLKNRKWLFTSEGELVCPWAISCYSLDKSLYGEITERSELYEILGFKKTEEDFNKELLNNFHAHFTPVERETILKLVAQEQEEEDIFDPDVEAEQEEFPEELVKDIQRLNEKTKENYQAAPKVNYEQVLRSIRKSRGNDREHLKLRYQGFCQLCKNPSPYWEVAEIFNHPEKELPMMNLSLCPNCATKYRLLRNDDSLIQEFKDNIISADLDSIRCIRLGNDQNDNVRFTQTHLAEIQVILRMAE